MWKTQYNQKGICPPTEPGSPFEWTWKEQYDKNGYCTVVHDRQFNMQEEIQSHAESVDLEILIARYESGDLDALNQKQPSFADIIDVPNSYADVMNMRAATKRYFYDLPIEVRSEFNQDFEQFAAQLGSEECNAIFEKYKKGDKIDES